LELPTDRVRPAQQSFAGDVVKVRLDAALTRGLKELSQRHGVTLYMMMLAAWAAVLSRLSGQEEVVIGMPAANRTRPEVEGLIGFFVNAQALRVAVTGSLRELLQRVKGRSLEAQAHQDLPFEQVVEIVNPPRSLSHAPICQVVLAWENTETSTFDLPGLKLSPVELSYGISKLDLGLDLAEVGDCIVGGLGYATALFDRGTIERHVGYLRRMLTAMVADEHQAVDQVDLLSEAEHAELLALGDGGPSTESIPGFKSECLYDLVAAQARRSPDAIAVLEPGREINYRQLAQHANGVAQRLSELGAGPETRVAILTDRSIESLVGVLGILAAGAAYVPIDPSYPDERVAFVLNDASVSALLTPRALSDRANKVARLRPTLADKVVIIGTAPLRESAPQSGVNEANAAYVIYTSGSTGTPKGVVVEQRSVINLVKGFVARHDFAGQRLLMIPPLVFDASIGDVFPVLAVGATLVLHPAPTELASLELESFCRDHSITGIDAPAALWRRWTDGMTDSLAPGQRLPGLALMMFGGESVPLEQVRRFAQLTENRVRLSNHYGPTEASVCATMLSTYDGTELSEGMELPIGRPLPGVQVYVLDQHRRLVPRGVEGELCIGGVGVARGYIGAPEQTEKLFVRDPFLRDPDARIYRTGDLARWNADGTLQFLGRRDQQVKIRGLRVELGEIESRLSEHPAVREAVVLAREDRPGDKRLVAYVTAGGPTDGTSATPADVEALRSYLSAVLPEYMVPAAYVWLPGFPVTSNGKLDRKALPAPEGTAFATRAYEEPVGEVESTLARIWAEVLKLDRIGRHDHFFELGGHSLLAVALVERMRHSGLHVDVSTVFAMPTLRRLAEAVRGESRTVTVPPNLIPAGCDVITPAMLPLLQLNQDDVDRIVDTVPGGVRNVQDIYPLAPLQESFLFHHLLQQQGDLYLSQSIFSIDRRECFDQYLEALQAVIARHDVLRTALVWEGLPEPVQVVLRHAPLIVEEVTFDAAAGNILEQLRARFHPEHYRLDLRRAPLWHLFIAADPPNRRWLVLELMHHLVSDHATLELLEREVRAILQGRLDQLPAPLPFRNFVAQARSGVSSEEHAAFFSRLLGDVDEVTAPFGLVDVQGDGSKIVEAHREVRPELCRRLRSRARALGVSAASMCHLAWAMVLARVSGRDDVVFGTVMFGRMQGVEGADRAMGVMINTLPVRIPVGDEGVEASVRKVHQLLIDLLKHEHAPLNLAQRCSAVRSPAPLFTSLMNYRHSMAGDASEGEAAATAGPLPGTQVLAWYERSNYPFDVSINDLGEGFSFDVQVDGSIDPRGVGALLDTALESLVHALEHAPTTPVRNLDVLPPAARQELLVTWNETRALYPDEHCIHELIQTQAASTPDAIAVVHEARELTYGELNRQANRLAHYLRGLGVKPDDRVAICAERSLEMLVGILATLKAGGAYVPLDPSYPSQRLSYMLQDCSPAVLLTDGRTSIRTGSRAVLVDDAIAVLDLNTDVWRWTHESQNNPDPVALGLAPRHLAYVIYTSGSTGAPHGVMVEHRQAVNLIHAHVRNCALTATDKVLQFASPSFDASVEEIFPPLTVGARIVLRPHGLVAPDEKFLQLLHAERITVLELPTAFWHEWAQQERQGRTADEYLPRLVVVGGEKADRRHLDSWRMNTRGHEVRWLNTYGPTEATVYASALSVDERSELPAGEIPIGRPISNAKIYILDAHRRPVPIGVTGELYIGGAGVARGYLNRPGLTAERFIVSPFVPGDRLYRTGDLGRWRADGNVEYLGRNDQQVKIRGFRIEPEEIEARLAEHPAVRQAVVLAREDRPGHKQLVAYFIAARSQESAAAIDSYALRTHLSAVLPDYMLPAAYVSLDTFPLTPNGKLDRKALPATDGDAWVTREYEAPVGELETTLSRIWSEALGLDRVGRHDDFFEKGGDSLLILRVINLLARTGREITVTEMFNHPTIESLAKSINATSAGVAHAGASLVRGGTQTPLFLTHDGCGDVMYCYVLARYLPASWPVYALPSPPPGQPQLRTVSAMAARMIDLIRQVRPAGPYRLAGWSFGGLLAYEIARQLLDRGEEVEFLGLIDTLLPEQGAGGPSDGSAETECYDPRPISIPVHVFAANERSPGWPAPSSSTLGWERRVPADLLHVMQVQGSHESMMKPPGVKVLGQCLTQVMECVTASEACV
jgi:amino acid adenylation domain-containing protein